MAEFDFAAALAREQQELEAQTEAERVARMSLADQTARGVRSFGTGVNDAVGSAIGFVPDAIGAGLRYVGIPSSRPGYYSDAAKSALNSVGDFVSGGHFKPANATERTLYATGEGAGDALSFAVPAAGVARVARGAAPVVSGVADALAANPAIQTVAGAVGGGVEQATGSPTAGLVASMATPLGLGALRGVVSPGLSQLNAEQQRLAALLKAEGVPLSPGQESGSRVLRGIEGTMDTLPGTSGNQNVLRQAQRGEYNRAVLERMGVTGETTATPDVVNKGLENAYKRIEDVYSRNNFAVDASAMQGIQTLADETRRLYGSDAQKALKGYIGEMLDKIRPGSTPGSYIVEGPAFQNLDSALSKRIRETSDGDVRSRLVDLQRTLRDSMENSILQGGTAEDAAALSEARRHYAVGKQIQTAMNAPTRDAIAGDISPAQLARVAAAGPGNKFASGQGDLRDLAAGGKEFVRDNIPNSGTPERSMWTKLLTGGFAGGAGGGFVGLDPVKSALMGGAAMALPSMVQGAYNSRVGQAYLRNQAAARMPAMATPGMFAATGATRLPSQLEGLLSPDDPRLYQ